ncbi:MAG: hypothetical protein JSR99_08345 [Proteobacteria bacterium]|nr:hypothetical protein [Pseudomonadota bacterium]
MAALSRPAVAEWAGLTMTQIDYLAKLGVAAPDVGGHRKRFSLGEARLVVIAGCAIANGISPRVLKEPIQWLRANVLWPSDVDLPESVADKMLEIEADRARSLARVETVEEHMVNYLARHVYMLRNLSDPLSVSDEDGDKIFEKAKAEEAAAAKSGALLGTGSEGASPVQIAIAQAKKLLSQKIKWGGTTYQRLHFPLEFDLACIGKRDFFIGLVARESEDGVEWKVSIGKSAVRIETEHAWLAIDVRRLFGDRTALT